MATIVILLSVVFLFHCLPCPALDLPSGESSRFIESSEGWLKVGKDSGSVKLSHAPLMLSGKDDGPNSWWFSAPQRFAGDKSAFYGGSLEYRVGFWRYNGDFQKSSMSDKWDIVFVSDKLKIGLPNVVPPLAFLHQVQVNLTESSGWLLEGSQRAPTKKEFKSLLSKLSGIWIRGGYYAGGEEVYLMGVKLSARAEGPGDLQDLKETVKEKEQDSASEQSKAKHNFDFKLEGSEGSLAFDSETLYFLSNSDKAPQSVRLSEISSVDVGSDDTVQVYGQNHEVVLNGGRFTSYNVSKLAKFFETVRKKTNELKKAKENSRNLARESPQHESSKENEKNSFARKASGQELPRQQTESKQQEEGFQQTAKAESQQKRSKKQVQTQQEDVVSEPPRYERTSKIHKHAGNIATDNFDHESMKSLQYQFLSGTERKRVLKVEKELDINSRAIYKRLEGGGGLLLLTSDALIIIPADPESKKKQKTGLHKIALENLISVEREGNFVEIYDKRKNDPIRVNIKHFPFQELMDLLDDISKIMRLV